MSDTTTLDHFEKEAFDILERILSGSTISSGCGTHKIERTAWHIQMSPSFAKLLLKHYRAMAPSSTDRGTET